MLSGASLRSECGLELPRKHDSADAHHDPLTDEWVLVSAGRTQRPWQGLTEAQAEAVAPAYDPACYLCPGNVRASGDRNPAYSSTFVFTNEFAA